MIFGKQFEFSEIDLAETLLNKYKLERDEMDDEFDMGNDCCHSCMTAGYWDDLCDEIERIENWMKNQKETL